MSLPTARPTILVVDDTPANLAILSEALKADYGVRVATDGIRALKMAASDPAPDLILLDVVLPDIDGHEVCRRLKADPRTHGIPVIFVTVMDEMEDEARGLALGGVDYITKPFSAAIVRARIATHLAASGHARQMERMIATLEAQARELAELNHTLEQRVADGVAQVERLGRMKRFFSPAVVDLMLSGTTDDPLRTHRREITAVFIDIRGYTAFAETSDPEEVMRVIGEFHDAMGALVMEYGGTVEHFAGDGIMIFFNDPVPVANSAEVAVQMAIAMQARFAALALAWRSRGYDLAMGIGIAQGYATIGTIGFEGRRDYGAVGPVTNLAARLCAEATAGQILISKRVLANVAETAAVEAIGEVKLKGFQRPVPAYQVTGRRGA